MKIIFSRSILKKEGVTSEKAVLVKAYAKGIFIVIKGAGLPKNSKLIKIYMTTIAGAKRAVFLVNHLSGDAFFLMVRSKNDPIGKNITIKNPVFKATLHKYLVLMSEDFKTKNIEVFEVKSYK